MALSTQPTQHLVSPTFRSCSASFFHLSAPLSRCFCPSARPPILQVLRVYPGGRLLVRMVPRLNLQILSLPKEQRPKGFAAAGGGRGGARPPQRFFDKAEILELSG